MEDRPRTNCGSDAERHEMTEQWRMNFYKTFEKIESSSFSNERMWSKKKALKKSPHLFEIGILEKME